MFKNFKKKSLKAKIGIIAFIVFMIVLVAYVLYSNFKPEPPVQYEIAEVIYGSVTDSLDVGGTVESGTSDNLIAVEGVMVEEVFVNVGDKVAKGDKLATFNVSTVLDKLNKVKADYDKALKDYNDAKASTDNNAQKKAELNDAINKKNAEIAALRDEIAALQKEFEDSASGAEMTNIPQAQIDAIAEQMKQNGASRWQIEAYTKALSGVKIPSAYVDNSKQEKLLQKNMELAQLISELSVLQAQNAMTLSSDNATVLDALKSVADSKKATYDSVKKIYDSMQNGWYAANDGIVSVVNIKPGEKFVPVNDTQNNAFDLTALLGGQSVNNDLISSLMGGGNAVPTGTGITVESYDDLIVSVTVGKADLLKVKTGMEAQVKSLNKEYDAEVIYVGATAQSSGLDINSLMSGTTGTNGATVKVKIKNPDENIVIGFDVDIKIKLNTVDDVLKVPVESVIYKNGEYSVFVFDEDESKVYKRMITKGSLDETSYEIIEGLAEGEKVVKSPDPNMEDGTKIAQKNA